MSIDVTKHTIPWIVFLIYLMGFMVYAFIPAERNADTMQVFLGVYCVHALCGLLLLRDGSFFLTLPHLISLFLLSRIAVFFMYPWLSDDVFGYLFYGKAELLGFNMYGMKADDPALMHLRDSAFDLMAFKPYQNIYPPLATFFMMCSAWIASFFPPSLYASLASWKLLLFLAESLGLYLLYVYQTHNEKSLMPILMYLAIPMTAIEGIGQAHNEILLLPFLMCIIIVRQTSTLTSYSLTGIACAMLGLLKLYPFALLVPITALTKDWKQLSIIIVAFLLTISTFSAPWFGGIWIGNMNSIYGYASVLQFYHGTYFNGVLLYGIRYALEFLNINEWWLLAPKIVTVIRGIGIMLMGIYARIRNSTFIHALYGTMFLTVIISSKVHTWYFIPVTFLGVIAGRSSIMVIASLMMATYVMYAVSPIYESAFLETSIWVIAGGFIILESYRSSQIFNTNKNNILP